MGERVAARTPTGTWTGHLKVFHCDHCRQLVFFENTHCVRCNYTLAYVPGLARVAALQPDGESVWQLPSDGARYRLCDNYSRENVCNWALPEHSPERLCESCRLTKVIPNLQVAGNREAWFKLEAAKRRLLYTLMQLGCAVRSKKVDPQGGLEYRFLAPDAVAGAVLTGHSHGTITVSVAEADDTERERQRVRLHEPYRTLLGHFRHESGHYFWERLLAGQARLAAFRELFGDERTDYPAALQQHYSAGPPANWQERFISAYAAAHPWEDWAESWAHYLHMTDMLETAHESGLLLLPARHDEPSLQAAAGGVQPTSLGPFEPLLARWFPLTYVLNNLNRSMGLPDGYPFVLSTPVLDKLRFVHETLAAAHFQGWPVTG